MPSPTRIASTSASGCALRRSTPAAPAPAAAAASRVHVVQPGENLTWIARRYGVTVSAIVVANGIADPSRIFGAQRLTIPGGSAPAAPPSTPAAPAPAAAAASRVHVVEPGENLTWIARRYGVTVSAIVVANGIADPSRIFGAQRLTIPGGSAAAVTSPANVSVPAGVASVMRERASIRDLIVAEATQQGVPPAFALAVAWQESGWRQGVVSHAGAVGVMQLLPTTAEWVGDTMLGGAVDVYDARHNVRAGVRLLAHYLGRYGGNRDLALAAYYQGQTATDRHGVFAISRAYVEAIRSLERQLGG